MSHTIDISFLDQPEFLHKIFPLAFNFAMNEMPQADARNADAYFIEVDKQVRVCSRYYVANSRFPTVFFFHGNGETIFDQGLLSSHFNDMGVNLFVTDYRGYGISDGSPTLTNLVQDCHVIFDYLKGIIKKENYCPEIFVMGRSLGSIPALELAYHYQKELRGLIIESGSAQNFKSVWNKTNPEDVRKLDGKKFYNKEKITEVHIPTLIIHGELDRLIPVQIGQALYDLCAASEKKLVIIKGGGHGDLPDVGYTQYYAAIEEFVKRKSQRSKRKDSSTQSTDKRSAKKNRD